MSSQFFLIYSLFITVNFFVPFQFTPLFIWLFAYSHFPSPLQSVVHCYLHIICVSVCPVSTVHMIFIY